MLGSDIVDLVVVKMEEHTPFGPGNDSLLAGNDVLEEVKPIYDYIKETLAQAADEMLLIAPLHRLSGIVTSQGNITGDLDITTKEVVYVSKPTDYLRLHTLQCSSWQRAVHEVVREQDPRYELQYNYWTRGSAQKPVVVDKGGDKLECYSLRGGAVGMSSYNVQEFSYVPHFDEATDYPTDVAEVIALNTARKVYGIFGDTERAAIMQKEIEAVMSVMAN